MICTFCAKVEADRPSMGALVQADICTDCHAAAQRGVTLSRESQRSAYSMGVAVHNQLERVHNQFEQLERELSTAEMSPPLKYKPKTRIFLRIPLPPKTVWERLNQEDD